MRNTRTNNRSARSTSSRTANKREYYVEGTAVRKSANSVPQREDGTPDYRKLREQRRIQEEEQKEREKIRRTRRAQEHELRMGKSYVVFLTMAVIVFCTFTGLYVQVQSDVTAKMKTISSLESQIADLKADNDETYKRINTVVNLDEVRDTAINEYGMSYAKADQIVYYSYNDDDYMNQYSEIPGK